MDSKSNKILKRKRGPNWEEDEITIFFHCYENVAKVLEDPKKDFNTNSKNNQVWLCLMNKFNANVKKVITKHCFPNNCIKGISFIDYSIMNVYIYFKCSM